MTPDPLLRGITPRSLVANVVCGDTGGLVVIAVVHRGGDGRLRITTFDGQVGALESVAGGAVELVGCGCYHRADMWELERLVELGVAGSGPINVIVGDVAVR